MVLNVGRKQMENGQKTANNWYDNNETEWSNLKKPMQAMESILNFIKNYNQVVKTWVIQYSSIYFVVIIISFPV